MSPRSLNMNLRHKTSEHGQIIKVAISEFTMQAETCNHWIPSMWLSRPLLFDKSIELNEHTDSLILCYISVNLVMLTPVQILYPTYCLFRELRDRPAAVLPGLQSGKQQRPIWFRMHTSWNFPISWYEVSAFPKFLDFVHRAYVWLAWCNMFLFVVVW